jgi:hypothetical protein
VDKFAQDKFNALIAGKTGPVDVTSALLTGATFRVYGSLADAQARVNPIAISKSTATGGAPVDPSTDGHSLIEGVANCGYAATPKPGAGTYLTGELVYGTYWVVETAAPAGYQLDSTPHQFVVDETTSWGTNGPLSPSCDTNQDGTPDATVDTVIATVPLYNPVTRAWDTTNDWAVARVFNQASATPPATTAPATAPPAATRPARGGLAGTGIEVWQLLAATLVALGCGIGLIAIQQRRRTTGSTTGARAGTRGGSRIARHQ